MKTEWVPRNEYGKKLQDPRWQKKRLEVMERDAFQCQACGDCRSMLNVHHVMYCPWERVEPWDEPDGLLVTLCGACHETEDGYFRDALYQLLERLGQAGIRTSHHIQRIAEITGDRLTELEDFGDGESPDEWAAKELAAEIARFPEDSRELERIQGLWFYEL